MQTGDRPGHGLARSQEQARALVRRGLADRTPGVAKAACALLDAWFGALQAECAPPRDSGGAAADAAGDPAGGAGDLGQPSPSGAPAPGPDPGQGAGLAPVLALLDALGAEAPEAEAALGALVAGGALDPRALAAAGGPRGGTAARARRATAQRCRGAAVARAGPVAAGADCLSRRCSSMRAIL